MKNLIRTFKQISILILAITFLGCEDDDAVLPQVVAGFTYTIDTDTGVVTFINISENANKYSWSFGDQEGTTSSLINPIFSYGVGSYTIQLTARNIAGAIDVFEDTLVILDEEVPLISLTGDAIINLTIGDTFTDPGATALDEVDGDLTANIVVGGDAVDVNAEGTYVITYNVSDMQGNEALEVERTVNVSAISCDDETEESLSASNLNITFLTNPGTTDTKGSGSGKFFQDNVTYEYVDNPDVSTDANRSCKVGKITKSGVQPWDNLQLDFDDKFVFSDGDNFTIKVYSPVSGYNVSLKLEDKTDGGIAQEVASTMQTTKTNEWEELTIPFGAVDSGKFDRLVIFFDVAGPANTNVYYIDDLKLNTSGGSGGGCTPDALQSLSPSNIDITFASDPGTTDTKGSISGQFFQDNVGYEHVDNPQFETGINNSCKVAKITKAGVQPWDNLQLDFDDKFTFSDGDNFTIKVYSPVSGYNVSLKLEDKTDGGIAKEVASTMQTTKTNEWEELTIPFGAVDSGKYDRLVIFFDVAGPANTNVYYIDDLKLNRASTGGNGGGGTGASGGCSGTLTSAVGFPVNFEACETFMATDGSVKFGDVISAELAANPSSTGINTSAYVLKVDKPVGANHWEGVQNAFPTDFNSSLTFKVKIYTTKANVTYRFEISNDPNDNAVGNPAGITKVVANANEWTEVEVTFTGVPPGGHNNFVIKPDDSGSGTVTAGAIHYFDDIRLE